jgi:hypothetical protein
MWRWALALGGPKKKSGDEPPHSKTAGPASHPRAKKTTDAPCRGEGARGVQFHSCLSPDLIVWLDPKLALDRFHP